MSHKKGFVNEYGSVDRKNRILGIVNWGFVLFSSASLACYRCLCSTATLSDASFHEPQQKILALDASCDSALADVLQTKTHANTPIDHSECGR